ncbi:putative transcriptional regulator of RNA polymerase [Pseudomonas phage EM]|uniref:Transcriptional regulator of RNA polymerase n=1 Tax=Pseudomonas phage EM TaxID=2936914 RepID=A0AAE9HHM8_9CAUD|nr:putative transcriptional regulator of RNA polymerase [Pseudomonas phage EM]UPW35977.1 putative transcriptional regulator of RNA polymerase [Pseudomonas phage EM]
MDHEMNRTTLSNKAVASILQMGIAYRNSDPVLTDETIRAEGLHFMCLVMEELFRCNELSLHELEQMKKFISDVLKAWDCLTAGSMALTAALNRHGQEVHLTDVTLADRDEVYVWLIWDLLKANR